MPYSTINKPSLHFNTVQYSGDGTSNRGITGTGFQPDLVVNKGITFASGAYNWYTFDSVRTLGARINWNTTAAEDDKSAEFISFDSDGVTVTNNAGSLNINGSGVTYNNYYWKAGTTSGITTNGSTVITPSAYSFSQTSGFSAVKYTGNGNTTTKVAHGLGSEPKMIIIKNLDDATDNWKVYHVGIGNTTAIQLNTSGATSGGSDHFYDTTPDTVNFTLGNNVAVNNSGENYIAYCFSKVKGFSAFGKYTGNGSTDGTFIYTGFRPSWLVIKRTDGIDSWFVYDNKRSPFNVIDDYILTNGNGANVTSSAVNLDFLSNGFKLRNTDGGHNASGGSYIYMCFAEQTLVGTNNVCSVAR